MTVDAVQLMLDVIKDNSPATIWAGSPLESFRNVANTNRGDIGEEFVLRYLNQHDIAVVKGENRVQEWDLEIQGKRFEVKTASEDSSGGFQFNHIRLDRSYHYLMCLAIRPREILFGCWRKGDVAEGNAGTLVRMAEGQSITFKLSRRPDHLLGIENLPVWVRESIGGVA